MDAVARQIQAVKAAQEHSQNERNWELRCDEIRKRDLFTNWEAIRTAVKNGFEQVKTEFPFAGIEYLEIPSRQLNIRKSSFPSVNVNVSISLDGSVILIKKQRRENANDQVDESSDGVCVEVNGNSTYYEYGDNNPVGVDEVAAIALQPILDSL